ncbi:hypothetical protein BDN72DRAFT_526215 [Pluteus cervinus]|uniref:Uncharacterized protein n=1 Tax=Pluteus cervinus TaxID=181527 RepID=A0ACD3A4A4_9AGAR|nr:hypothetical protein BDN72DRAFT_526215 [Pluteus cervinus]
MEDLAWQFPAEPVERAAVRFCEAVARWRGKPELETQKPPTSSLNPSSSPTATTSVTSPMSGLGMTPSSTPMTIESLVHSNPTSPTIGNATVSQPPMGVPGLGYGLNMPTPTPPVAGSAGSSFGGPPSSVGVNMKKKREVRKPSISVYFVPGPGEGSESGGLGWSGQRKRQRSPEDVFNPSKRIHT